MLIEPAREGPAFDPLSMLAGSSPPMFFLSVMLLAASALAWFIIVLKVRQLRRWQRAEHEFRISLSRVADGRDRLLGHLLQHEDAIGARIVSSLVEGNPIALDVLDSTVDYAMVREQQRVLSFMTLLATIGAAAPLAGLFGTVYGIMEAFSLIGREKSAALPLIAPAIGDALITTALGLAAAIPAVVAFNLLTRRLEDLTDETAAFVRSWVRQVPSSLFQALE